MGMWHEYLCMYVSREIETHKHIHLCTYYITKLIEDMLLIILKLNSFKIIILHRNSHDIIYCIS